MRASAKAPAASGRCPRQPSHGGHSESVLTSGRAPRRSAPHREVLRYRDGCSPGAGGRSSPASGVSAGHRRRQPLRGQSHPAIAAHWLQIDTDRRLPAKGSIKQQLCRDRLRRDISDKGQSGYGCPQLFPSNSICRVGKCHVFLLHSEYTAYCDTLRCRSSCCPRWSA